MWTRPLVYDLINGHFGIRTASNIYRLLDEVLATGTPLEVDRNGRKLLIVVPEVPGRLSKLVRRPDVVVGDSEDLVHQNWSPSVESTLGPGTAASNAPRGSS